MSTSRGTMIMEKCLHAVQNTTRGTKYHRIQTFRQRWGNILFQQSKSRRNRAGPRTGYTGRLGNKRIRFALL